MKSLPVLISIFFVLGCVEIDDSERDIATENQAIAPGTGQRGETHDGQVTFIGFKKDRLEIVGVYNPLDSEPVELHLRLAPYCRDCNLSTRFEEPPDPWRILPDDAKCADTAEKWNWALNKPKWDDEKTYKHITDELINKLAKDKCTADVTWVDFGEEVKHLANVSFPSQTEYWKWDF